MCPGCGVELKFLNTSLIAFQGYKLCTNCFQRTIAEKLKSLDELKILAQKPAATETVGNVSNLEIKPPESIIIKNETKGFRFFRACLGFFALGPFGLLCGLCGSGKTKTTVIRK